VTYDRRGLSRSILDAPAESLTISTHSDDAHRLLAELTNQPALVFGSSIGALVGLDLVARHPEQVRVLVAHEPPTWELLPDAERDRAMRSQARLGSSWRSRQSTTRIESPTRSWRRPPRSARPICHSSSPTTHRPFAATEST